MARTGLLVRTGLASLIAASLIGLTAPPSSAADLLTADASTIAGATLAAAPPNPTSPPGVSPDVYFEDETGTYYMWAPSVPNMRMYSSTDGSTWSEVAGAALPRGFDPTVIKLGPGNYRMYFGGIAQGVASTVQCSQQRKSLYYATSTDLVTWTTQPGTLFDDLGCGVPDIVRKPDGSYLMYYVTMTGGHGVHMATSPDGLSWTAITGLHPTTEDIVDPSVIVMPDSTYLMVSSDMGRGTQQLHIMSSPDGIDWTLRSTPLYAPAGVSAFDPNLNLINGRLRVWYGYAPQGAYDDSHITNGILTLARGSVPSSSKVGKPGTACKKSGTKVTYQGKTLVCRKVKGSLVWKRA